MPSYGELLDLFILIIILIVPFLGLLVWAGNKVTNSNEETHYFTGEEMVQTCNETYQLFEQDHEEDTLHGLVRTHCACSFCGKLSHITSVCSSCNTAFYCSEVCKDTHWRFFHKYECVDEIESAKEQQEGSPSRGTHCLLKEPEIESSKYSLFNEVVEQKTDEGEVYCIEERIEQMRYYDACAACGNASTKKCSRCKAIKYW
ncbi:hypothetical protein RIF29_30646 [Crotalaria pallida]|uniref:MYND-type domain-containing protein n=1 Tax=Crotalaria pallida TaxID=3830 RepID=A0AAN9EGM6_CROPI